MIKETLIKCVCAITESFLRLTRKWPEGAAVAALRNIDAVSRKKHRATCRRINQRLLNTCFNNYNINDTPRAKG